MFTRKSILIGLVLLVVFGSTVGFGQDKVKIRVWSGIPGENGPQQMAEAFMRDNPGIEVEYIRYVNDETGNTKLDTALLSGDQVDVFVSHGPDRTSSRIVGGLAEPLDAYFKKDKIDPVKDFGEAYNTYRGKTYAIPMTNVDDFIWLNKKMFDEAGIPIPKAWTWDEYREIAKKLTKGSGGNKVYGSMVHVAWPDIWMKPAYIALGPKSYSKTTVFNLDNSYFQKSLQLRYDLENTDQSQVPMALQKSSKLTLQDMFFKERAAMLYAGSWIIRYCKDQKNYPHAFVSAFAPMPTWEKQPKTVYNSCGSLDECISINKKSPNKTAAWKYVKYWATEGYHNMIPGGKIPGWEGADRDRVAKLLLGENPEQFFDLESLKRVVLGGNGRYFVTPLSPARREIASLLEQEADKCLIGEVTVTQAIANMKTKALETMKKAN